MKQRTPAEIRAQLILNAKRKEYAAQDVLAKARKEKSNKDILLGKRIGFGMALIQLMLYWEASEEDLKDFVKTNDKFYETYESGNPDDVAEIMELFKQLKDKIGYDILSGEIDDSRGNEAKADE